MRIGLVSAKMKDNDIEHQLAQLEYWLEHSEGCELLCFGESFLQGFEGLTWNYEEDLKRALDREDPVMRKIRELAEKYECGISFGFIEKEEGILYSSNMVVDRHGEILDIYRRASVGWKEPIATEQYREGEGPHTFRYGDYLFATAICGDLWEDDLLEELEALDPDVLLWPLYIDYAASFWQEGEEAEYAERVGSLRCPTLLINSFVEAADRAKGGCDVFHKGRVVAALPMGAPGILVYDFLPI